MLDSALLYQQAYIQYKFLDIDFKYSLSDEEWKRVESIVKFLKPFYEIVPEANILLQILSSKCMENSNVWSSLLGENVCHTSNNEMRDDLEEFDVFENQLESGRDKTQSGLYLEEPKLDHKGNPNFDVLAYRKENRGRYPELLLMARDILSIPITTATSESTFSIGGRIIG
uniref:HAT C-terminal dimerisation domain-containing protein n=1 Tax=Solanum lycopersicum TaxID=4081 RepID=A0A3Q7J9A6_SOLLC